MLAAILCSMAFFAPAPASLQEWAGVYEYSEGAPPDLAVQYVIRISPDGRVAIAVDGHLTMIHVAATAMLESSGAIAVLYEHDAEDQKPSTSYQRPERLFSLRKQGAKYYLRWGALTSQLDRSEAEVEIRRTK